MIKHELLAANLRRGIAEGRHPIGEMLPTEMTLCASFGVSRATVRQALATLRAEGLITTRPGVGAKVVAASSPMPGSFAASFQSLQDLTRFGRRAHLKVLRTECESENAALAEALGFGRGRRFLRVDALRLGDDGKPLSETTIYLDALYASVAAEIDGAQDSVAGLLAKRCGIGIGRVAQKISAAALSAPSAKALGGKRGAPTLLVCRRYFDADGKLFMVSRSVCAPDLAAAVTLFAPRPA